MANSIRSLAPLLTIELFFRVDGHHMLRIFYILLLSITGASIAYGQINSREEADSLLLTLRYKTCDSCRANTLIKISDYILHLRHISKEQFDSVSKEMAEVRLLNVQLHKASINERLLLLQALYLKAQGNNSAGKELVKKLIAKLTPQGDQLLLGRAYYELSDFFSYNFLQSTMTSRIYYLNESIKAYSKTQDKRSLGRDYRFLADLHLMTDSTGRAFVEANTALSLYHAANYKDIQGILALLGRLYYSQQNYKESINYELMALNTAKKSKQDNVRLICQINNGLGTIFLKLGDFDNAIYYFDAALNIAKREKDNGTVYLLSSNLVDTYLKAGRGRQAISFFQRINHSFPVPKQPIFEVEDFGVGKTFLKIYISLGLFNKARPFYKSVLKQANNPKLNYYSRSEYYELIARTNIGLCNFKFAEGYLKKSEKLLFSMKDYSDLAANYRLEADLDTARGDYRKGIRYVLAAQKIEESLFNKVKSHQIKELQIAYLTSEKESQISLLQQKTKTERANLQKANLVRNLSLGGAISLLVIAMLLYRQNQQKMLNNRKLGSLVAEKEWLLKEVHHRVKNNLHTVVCLLESQASFLADEALLAVENIRGRVYAMSLIHQKLYQDNKVQSIEIEAYISELAQYLRESFDFLSSIRLYVDVSNVNLNVSEAIPVGLIINEAVNNAYKYAFPNGRHGEILIILKKVEANIRLEIRDNGVGIPFDPANAISDSLGIELMKGLTMDIKGNIEFLRDFGTSIIVTFQCEPTSVGFSE